MDQSDQVESNTDKVNALALYEGKKEKQVSEKGDTGAPMKKLVVIAESRRS